MTKGKSQHRHPLELVTRCQPDQLDRATHNLRPYCHRTCLHLKTCSHKAQEASEDHLDLQENEDSLVTTVGQDPLDCWAHQVLPDHPEVDLSDQEAAPEANEALLAHQVHPDLPAQQEQQLQEPLKPPDYDSKKR